jgi:hypothetical protein
MIETGLTWTTVLSVLGVLALWCVVTLTLLSRFLRGASDRTPPVPSESSQPWWV